MHTRFDEDDAARALIERRWFSFELHRAANRLREECESLAEVLQATQEAWHDARSRLAELEAMRAALGEELARTDACCPVPPVNPQFLDGFGGLMRSRCSSEGHRP